MLPAGLAEPRPPPSFCPGSCPAVGAGGSSAAPGVAGLSTFASPDARSFVGLSFSGVGLWGGGAWEVSGGRLVVDGPGRARGCGRLGAVGPGMGAGCWTGAILGAGSSFDQASAGAVSGMATSTSSMTSTVIISMGSPPASSGTGVRSARVRMPPCKSAERQRAPAIARRAWSGEREGLAGVASPSSADGTAAVTRSSTIRR